MSTPPLNNMQLCHHCGQACAQQPYNPTQASVTTQSSAAASHGAQPRYSAVNIEIIEPSIGNKLPYEQIPSAVWADRNPNYCAGCTCPPPVYPVQTGFYGTTFLPWPQQPQPLTPQVQQPQPPQIQPQLPPQFQQPQLPPQIITAENPAAEAPKVVVAPEPQAQTSTPAAPATPVPAVPVPPAPVVVPPETTNPVPPVTEATAPNATTEQPQEIKEPEVTYNEPKEVQPAPAGEENKAVTENKEAETKVPAPALPEMDLATAVAALKSDDIEKQASTMENISITLENAPEKGKQFVDANVVNALVDILNKDTSKMEGPTPRQLVLRQKLIEGQGATPAEEKEARQLSAMESAEKNKQYALYTLAMVQNTLTKELEKKGEKIAFNELPAIDGVIETATKNPNPMLRASAIAALSYVSRPEYREVLDSIFEAAEKDEDDSVKDVARYARSKMNATGQATGAENAAPAEAKQEENKAEAAK